MELLTCLYTCVKQNWLIDTFTGYICQIEKGMRKHLPMEPTRSEV